ncbi:MAG: adenylate kinase [Butyrivibrio sp.]|nr:adenylate kinase [Butyrivibrio sp.]
MVIVMLGAPGAGKGTQADLICAEYNIPHMSTGDIFRANIKNGTELGKRAKSYMDKGELVPDQLTVEILLDRVAQDDCKEGYVLDGFPRTIPQAEVLDDALGKLSAKVDYAINVDVPDDAIVARMSGRRSCPDCGTVYHIVYNKPAKEGTCDKCGASLVQREDDAEETVRNRLKVYHDQTAPLIDFYEKKGALRTVDGTQDMKQVTDNIFAILKG